MTGWQAMSVGERGGRSTQHRRGRQLVSSAGCRMDIEWQAVSGGSYSGHVLAQKCQPTFLHSGYAGISTRGG